MKNITLALLFMLPIVGLAQEKKNSWFIRPSYSFSQGSYFLYDKNFEYWYANKLRTVYGGGIDVGRTFGKFYAAIGGGYQEFGCTAMSYENVWDDANYGATARFLLHQKQYLHYATASVSGGYMDRWFYTHLAVSGIRLIQGGSKVLESEWPGIPTWENDPDFDPNREAAVAKKHAMAASVSIGINIPIMDRLSVQIGGEVKTTIIDPYVNPGPRPKMGLELFTNFGGVTGLVWKFGK